MLQQQLAEHLTRTAVVDRCELSLLAHGESNAIFRLNQTSLIRVAVNTPNHRFGGENYRVTQFERVILDYLRGTQIGHDLYQSKPEPTPDFPYTYLITNYLEGVSLDYSRSHLQQCATTLARLHRLPLQSGYEIEALRSQIPIVHQPLTLFYEESKAYAQPYLESPAAEAEIVAMIRAVLAKAEARLGAERLLADYPHLCLVHSDHTFENWVINPQVAHLIDWEWAELGSAAGDLGHFLSPVTVRRQQGYHLPPADRAFFLQCYYDALEDKSLVTTMERHFAAFGAFPAVRSLCWTAGYWITANRWYVDADSPDAAERLARLQRSRQQFPELWQEIMAWLEEEV